MNQIVESNTMEQRHAQALAEIKQMHTDYQRMQADLLDARRRLDQQENMIALLKEERDKLRDDLQVSTRKLIRLAAAMSGIGRLTADAEEIMRSVQEWQDLDSERSLEDIFDKLPANAGRKDVPHG